MQLKDLIQNVSPLKTIGDLSVEVKIAYDSRQVEEGSLFICIEGFKTDGHKYIKNAIQNSAVAIIVEKSWKNIRKE